MGERAHLGRPGIGLATHVEDVVAVLELEDLHDVVLCGHSYGGMPVSGAADLAAERIRLVIYIDALGPATASRPLISCRTSSPKSRGPRLSSSGTGGKSQFQLRSCHHRAGPRRTTGQATSLGSERNPWPASRKRYVLRAHSSSSPARSSAAPAATSAGTWAATQSNLSLLEHSRTAGLTVSCSRRTIHSSPIQPARRRFWMRWPLGSSSTAPR
jgi:pimeloyl-ACP methyl ester carboxylesterase